uniref:RUN domain-containing protein n=1 Tax=Macrostomum lignano TaxID=282301 RepID=A0A1I8J2T9_9PLAT
MFQCSSHMTHSFASTEALRRSVIADLHQLRCPLVSGTSPCASVNSSADKNRTLSTFYDRLLFSGDEPGRASLLEWLLYGVTKATALPSNDPEATLAILVSLRVANVNNVSEGVDLVSGAASRHSQLVMYSRLLALMKSTLGADSSSGCSSVVSSSFSSVSRPIFSSTPANSFCGLLDTSAQSVGANANCIGTAKVRHPSTSSNCSGNGGSHQNQPQQKSSVNGNIANIQQFLHQVCSGSLANCCRQLQPTKALVAGSREVRQRVGDKPEPEMPLPPHLRHALACRMAATDQSEVLDDDSGEEENLAGGNRPNSTRMLSRRLRSGIDADASLLERLRQRRQEQQKQQEGTRSAGHPNEEADDIELARLQDAVELRSTVVELRCELARLAASISATSTTSLSSSLPEVDDRLDKAVELAAAPLSDFLRRSEAAGRTAESVSDIRHRLQRLSRLGGGGQGQCVQEPAATLSLLASCQEI